VIYSSTKTFVADPDNDTVTTCCGVANGVNDNSLKGVTSDATD
jgi:hypothetical protein